MPEEGGQVQRRQPLDVAQLRLRAPVSHDTLGNPENSSASCVSEHIGQMKIREATAHGAPAACKHVALLCNVITHVAVAGKPLQLPAQHCMAQIDKTRSGRSQLPYLCAGLEARTT